MTDYPPGLRLRRTREALGLTYRDVEKASYEIAVKRGRPDFILHISRLADIENRNVVPTLHKLFSLSAILHLDPVEISAWYEAPFHQTFQDSTDFPPPRTHLAESVLPLPVHQSANASSYPSDKTGLLDRRPDSVAPMPGVNRLEPGRFRYGHVGLSDRRMVPLLRPGSTVVIDTACCDIDAEEWSNEYDRPMYFVELRTGYRCGWFQKDKSRLIMQPHTLSRCAPEAWRTPEDAEVVGKIVGVATFLNEPWNCYREGPPSTRSDWSGTIL
jgi:transcriptional regulator with XRE-family HTH domain